MPSPRIRASDTVSFRGSLAASMCARDRTLSRSEGFAPCFPPPAMGRSRPLIAPMSQSGRAAVRPPALPRRPCRRPPQAVQDWRAGAGQRPPHQDRDGLCLSLPKRVRPRPSALDRHGTLTRKRRQDISPRPAGPHCARHDSPRLRAGALATIPCTARTTASN